MKVYLRVKLSVAAFLRAWDILCLFGFCQTNVVLNVKHIIGLYGHLTRFTVGCNAHRHQELPVLRRFDVVIFNIIQRSKFGIFWQDLSHFLVAF